MKKLWLVAVTGLVLAAAVWWRIASSSTSEVRERPVVEATSYVGSQTCATCHAAEAAEWESSQHARAMAEATDATVRGNFDNAQVTYNGVTSVFFRRDGRFFVRTDGADGHLAEFEIAHTFGLEPLQQYLIALPGGRLQALGIAWDARPAADGGQRWFHLYADDAAAAGDPLHWTGYLQNWNFMCADCHSTNVRKGYDMASRRFNTTWSEVSVGCEACHGPGSAHVSQAQTQRWGERYGLTAQLTERRGVTWSFDAAAGVPVRSEPRTTSREVETCARCHARREQLTDDWRAGDRHEDGFRPSLIATPLYHPDGQQRDEVYTYGSFLQSRMYAKGVTCSDCHSPHSGRLRFSGNATCTQCHQDPRYDSTAHHLHQPGSAGASCAACHMPTTTYMQIDPRHDHSFRIPRPDLTVSLGVPNSCTMSCHANRPASWAAAALARLTGRAPTSDAMAEAFAAFDRRGADASAAVQQIAVDRDRPAIVRASAIERLASAVVPPGLPLEALVRDDSPMVRRAALAAARARDDATRLRVAVPLLVDPMRTVRIAAAQAIIDLADRALAGLDRDRFESAFAELVAELQFNADRPEAQVNLGTAWMARGRTGEAIAAFREATALDPAFVPAFVNLADAHRALGNDAQAYSILRDVVARHPTSADARHALGLALVRQRRIGEALDELGQAARLNPDSSRYSYVYAVALHDSGQADEALRVLRASLVRHPDDYDMLMATALYSERAGRLADARAYVDRVLRLRPDDAAARAMAARIGPTGALQ